MTFEQWWAMHGPAGLNGAFAKQVARDAAEAMAKAERERIIKLIEAKILAHEDEATTLWVEHGGSRAEDEKWDLVNAYEELVAAIRGTS